MNCAPFVGEAIYLSAFDGIIQRFDQSLNRSVDGRMRITKVTAALLLGVLLATLGACGTRVESHGNLLDPELVADITDGGISKQEMLEILGSPSSVNSFGQDTWYYISERTETLAFFAPEVKERQVLIIKFDEKGVMQSLEHKDLTDGRQLAHVERLTPTFGQELTVIGQIIGNFQRFKKNK
mgnify:FL=1